MLPCLLNQDGAEIDVFDFIYDTLNSVRLSYHQELAFRRSIIDSAEPLAKIASSELIYLIIEYFERDFARFREKLNSKSEVELQFLLAIVSPLLNKTVLNLLEAQLLNEYLRPCTELLIEFRCTDVLDFSQKACRLSPIKQYASFAVPLLAKNHIYDAHLYILKRVADDESLEKAAKQYLDLLVASFESNSASEGAIEKIRLIAEKRENLGRLITDMATAFVHIPSLVLCIIETVDRAISAKLLISFLESTLKSNTVEDQSSGLEAVARFVILCIVELNSSSQCLRILQASTTSSHLAFDLFNYSRAYHAVLKSGRELVAENVVDRWKSILQISQKGTLQIDAEEEESWGVTSSQVGSMSLPVEPSRCAGKRRLRELDSIAQINSAVYSGNKLGVCLY